MREYRKKKKSPIEKQQPIDCYWKNRGSGWGTRNFKKYNKNINGALEGVQ